jgi:hypothetical protein
MRSATVCTVQSANPRLPTSSEQEDKSEGSSPMSSDQHLQMLQVIDSDCTARELPTPPCIRGQIIGTEQHDHLVLQSLLPKGLPEKNISGTPDRLLADHFCQTRLVFPFPRNDDDTTLVQCLLPPRKVSTHRFQLEYIIVRLFADEDAPLTVMKMALVRDCLRGADRG